MSTPKDKKQEPDYQSYMRATPLQREKRTGMKERLERRLREAFKKKITICLDTGGLEEFKRMAPDGKGDQNLSNQALREWLAAQGVRELVREELTELVDEAVEAIKGVSMASRARDSPDFSSQ